jgi:hypothetical protein
LHAFIAAVPKFTDLFVELWLLKFVRSLGGIDNRRCCGRKIAADRMDKQEEICARVSEGDEGFRLEEAETAAHARNWSRDPPKPAMSRFREEHEQLVQALRAAYKEARQQGKALGPQPALPKYEMANDDRVQCPFCRRWHDISRSASR